MSEQLTGERARRPDQSAQAAAQIGRAALAGELSPSAPSGSPIAGQRIVIEPGPGRVRFEPLVTSEPDWDGWDQKLVGQLERRGQPTALFELEADLAASGWPPVSPNSLLLQLVAACERDQIQKADWGVYAPAGYDCQADPDGPPPLPTVPARLLDVLAWARGALSLSSIASSLNSRPTTPGNLDNQARHLRQSGRLYQQGPSLYALTEYSIEGIQLSKRGLVAAVVDQLLAAQGGAVHALQVQPLASQVVQSLAGRVDQSVLSQLTINSDNVRTYLHELKCCHQLKRVDDQTYIRPDCDPEQVRLPDSVRLPPQSRPKPKSKPRPARPEVVRQKAPTFGLDQRIINALEAINHKEDPTVSKQDLLEFVNTDGHQQRSAHHFTKRLAALSETDSIQRPRRGFYAAKEARIERRSAARIAPGLGRRIMRTIRQLDNEDLFDSDEPLLDDLFERVNLDGNGPVSRGSFDALAVSMIRRYRCFRRDGIGDEGGE